MSDISVDITRAKVAVIVIVFVIVFAMLCVIVANILDSHELTCDDAVKHSELGCKCDCQKFGWEFWDYKSGGKFRQPECWCIIKIMRTEIKRIW